MRRGYFTPPVLIILAVIIFAVAILIALNTDLVKRIKKEPSPTPIPSAPPASVTNREPTGSAETTNWKVLNNENGFSLEYPNSLKALGDGIEVDETDAYDVTIATKPGDPQDSSPSLHINISPKASTIYKDMTLAQISKENYDANQANKYTFKQVTTPLKLTTLDGKPAYTYTILASGFSGKWSGWTVNASVTNVEKLTVIESENQGNYFIVVYSAEDPIITKILSTFQFID